MQIMSNDLQATVAWIFLQFYTAEIDIILCKNLVLEINLLVFQSILDGFILFN